MGVCCTLAELPDEGTPICENERKMHRKKRLRNSDRNISNQELQIPINDALLSMEFFQFSNDTYSNNRKCEFSIATKPKNKPKNRYGDVLPYDNNLVKLRGNEYINASPIEVKGRTYIAAQWPLNKNINGIGTEDVWWNVIFEQDIAVVLSLQRASSTKHVPYFPERLDRVKYTKNFGILATDTHEDDVLLEIDCLVMKKKRMKKYLKKKKSPGSDKTRTVKIIIYKLWPDNGLPGPDMETFKSVVDRVDECSSDKTSAPILVHCSAGIGRSGVFILTHSILSSKDGCIGNIDETLRAIRSSRKGMVQTCQQYLFCYHFLWHYLRQ